MSAAGLIVAVMDEAVGALGRLDADELDAIEQRLLKLARGAEGESLIGPWPLCSTEELTARLELLGRCVAMTAENLQVLGRLTSLRTAPIGVTPGRERV